MALFQRMFAGGVPPRGQPTPPSMPEARPGAPSAPSYTASEGGNLDFPQIQAPGGGARPPGRFRRWRPRPRLCARGADHQHRRPARGPDPAPGRAERLRGRRRGGPVLRHSGRLHNVLRDLQESPLGQKANQLESMTIEMVAMLFDFVFDTKDLPDGIKALLARLQIPCSRPRCWTVRSSPRRATRRGCSSTSSRRRGSAGRRSWARTIRSTARSKASSTRCSTGSPTTSDCSRNCAATSGPSSPRRKRQPRRTSR